MQAQARAKQKRIERPSKESLAVTMHPDESAVQPQLALMFDGRASSE